jgi:hypothetical protein
MGVYRIFVGEVVITSDRRARQQLVYILCWPGNGAFPKWKLGTNQNIATSFQPQQQKQDKFKDFRLCTHLLRNKLAVPCPSILASNYTSVYIASI